MQVKKGASVRIECSASGKFHLNIFICMYKKNSFLNVHQNVFIFFQFFFSTLFHRFVWRFVFISFCFFFAIPSLFINFFTSFHSFHFFSIDTGNPSPNITWTKKFENLPSGKHSTFFFNFRFFTFFFGFLIRWSIARNRFSYHMLLWSKNLRWHR